jgi:hypothetical protein
MALKYQPARLWEMFGPAKRHVRSNLLEMRGFDHGRPPAMPKVPCKTVERVVSKMRRRVCGEIAVLRIVRFQSF